MESLKSIRTLLVSTQSHQYPIQIMAGLLQTSAVQDVLKTDKVLVITDQNVEQLYLKSLLHILSAEQIEKFVMQPGEEFKSIDQWNAILRKLIDNGFNRDSVIIAFGGGVVGDVAGFAASCFHRGIRLVQIPTTLLSQVDSSVGGKTAINLFGEKNVIGSFHQPSEVFIDPLLLNTLSDREYLAGLAEVIKYALIADRDFFTRLNNNSQSILSRDTDELIYIINTCCKMKADIVALDEKEQGQRALLNLGHTFAHALEAITNYHQFLHGEAVAIGLYCQALLSNSLGYLSVSELDNIEKLLVNYGFSYKVPKNINLSNVLELMYRDKKVQHSKLRFVITKSVGQASIVQCNDKQLLMEVLAHASG